MPEKSTQIELINNDPRLPSGPVNDDPRSVVLSLVQKVFDQGLTPDTTGAFKELVGVMERLEDRYAERKFAEAFVKLQAEIPAVRAERPVPGSNGAIRYMFAPLEDIMQQVRPILQKHGFTVTFSSEADDKRVKQTCTLTHAGGHSRNNSFAARIGKGPPGATETQSDGAAGTYAKRYALCDALGIVIQHGDTDGRNDREENAKDSPPISWERAKFLQDLTKELGVNEAQFLRYAGVSKFEEIRESEYATLHAALEKKRRP